MRATLKIKYPTFAKAPNMELIIAAFKRANDAITRLQRLTMVVPSEAVMIFIVFKIILIGTSENFPSLIYAPYAGLLVVLMIRFLGTDFEVDSKKFDVDGTLLVVSVVAYALWISAVAVLFFLCSLLLMTWV